ncbi:MAG: hypothetical protein AB7E55_31410 [Pigmentiphaga sp.]
MALNALIGALRVSLGIDTAQFEAGLSNAQKSLSKSEKIFNGFTKAINIGMAGVAIGAGAIGALGATALAMSKNVADLAAEAKTAGVAFEEFQKLKYAAEQNQVSVEALTDGLKEMALRADEFVSVGGGSAAEAFRRLGFGATDLSNRLKEPGQLFEEIIDRISKLKTSAQIRVADEIFGGTGGEQFVRLMRGGAEGIRQLKDEAERLGLVIDADTGRRAQVFTQQIDTLGKVIRTNFQAGLVSGFLGNMKDLKSVFADPAFVNGIRQAGIALGSFMTIALKYSKEIIAVSAGITAMFLAAQVGAKGVPAMLAGVVGTLATYATLLGQPTAATDDLAASLLNLQDVFNNPGGGSGIPAENETVTRVKESIAALTREAANWDWLTAALGRGKDAYAEMETAIAITNERLALGVDKVPELAGRWEQAALKAAQAEKAHNRVAEGLQRLRDVGEEVGQVIGSAFERVILDSGSLKEAIADVIKALARMILQASVLGPLQQAMGNLFAGAGGSTGTVSMGSVGSLFGFANGGAFTVGGSGGIDSQLVAFRASPNEQVEVTKPGQRQGGSVFNYAPQIDARGADPSVLPGIKALLEGQKAELLRMLPDQMKQRQMRGSLF